jgi:hypothetical protein
MSDEFVEKFVSSLKKLKVHNFVAQQQYSFLKETESSLQDGEVIVLGISQKIIYYSGCCTRISLE